MQKQQFVDVQKWAKELNKETFEQWNNNYKKWERGFQVFYSPVRKSPDVMILTLNPGQRVDVFEKSDNFKRAMENDFAPPDPHYYKYPNMRRMSVAVRNFFEGNMSVLDKSVIMPILFYRSKSIKSWKEKFDEMYPDSRKDVESFCHKAVIEAIGIIKPKSLLVIGKVTLERLVGNNLGKYEKNRGMDMYGRAKQMEWIILEWNGIPVFCVRHLTGARFSTKGRKRAMQRFEKFLKDNT